MNAQRLRELNEFRKQAQDPNGVITPSALNQGAFGKTWGGSPVMNALKPQTPAQAAPAPTPAPPPAPDTGREPVRVPAPAKDSRLITR